MTEGFAFLMINELINFIFVKKEKGGKHIIYEFVLNKLKSYRE